MEDNRLEITRAQWKGWIDLITREGDGIVDQLNSAAEDIMRASEHQTEAKWGTLPGPQPLAARTRSTSTPSTLPCCKWRQTPRASPTT